MNTSGVPGLSNFDVNDHFSIQQVDADQTNEEKRLFMEQLNQIGVGLIDAQIAQPSLENLLGGANNPLNKFVNSDCWQRKERGGSINVDAIDLSFEKIIERLSIGDSRSNLVCNCQLINKFINMLTELLPYGFG